MPGATRSAPRSVYQALTPRAKSRGSESDADAGAIGEATIAAFRTLDTSNHTEQFIIEALRAAKALVTPKGSQSSDFLKMPFLSDPPWHNAHP